MPDENITTETTADEFHSPEVSLFLIGQALLQPDEYEEVLHRYLYGCVERGLRGSPYGNALERMRVEEARARNVRAPRLPAWHAAGE